MHPLRICNFPKPMIFSEVGGGGNPAVTKEMAMDFASLCLFLGVLFALGTLLLKVIEVARDK